MMQFLGFAPDIDPYTEGVITDCEEMIPVANGFKSAPDLVTGDYSALAAACRGAALVFKVDGSQRFFAGTATALYEGSGGSWTDVTRTVGGAYNIGTDASWQFAQFGNTTLAANVGDVLQQITAGSDFADVSGAPQAAHITTAGKNSQFVMIANTVDGTYGTQEDRWWCCGAGDYTDWTPALSTQCTTGRLISIPGPITGLKQLGDYVIAYKEHGMFLGQYVGAPSVWQWQAIAGDVGCESPDAIVDIGSAHLFIGKEEIYATDGNSPIPIGNDVKDWFFSDLDAAYIQNIASLHDRANSLVYWFYPSDGSGGTLDSALIYNYKYKKWGKASYTVQAAVSVITGGTTYDNLGSDYTTYDDLTGVSYDGQQWKQGDPTLGLFNGSHTLQTLTGAGQNMVIHTNIYGHDDIFSLVQRIRPRYIQGPTSATLTNFYKDESEDAFTEDVTSTQSDGKFDFLRNSKWHKFKFMFTGETIVSGFTLGLKGSGRE